MLEHNQYRSGNFYNIMVQWYYLQLYTTYLRLLAHQYLYLPMYYFLVLCLRSKYSICVLWKSVTLKRHVQYVYVNSIFPLYGTSLIKIVKPLKTMWLIFNLYYCYFSPLPWFEIFYRFLNLLAEISNRTENNDITHLLGEAYDVAVPDPCNQVTLVAQEEVNLSFFLSYLVLYQWQHTVK